MSSMRPPGFSGQATARLWFRVGGIVLLLVALLLLGSGLADLFSPADSSGGPHHVWMLFVGVLLLAPAGWCLQAGFVGVATRYAAGETLPVVKDSAAYLSDGEGILGVGRTVDDAAEHPEADGPYCSQCGTRNDAKAAFCDHCGHARAR
jgi:hypothetical protein